jgi:hypothetical protein
MALLLLCYKHIVTTVPLPSVLEGIATIIGAYCEVRTTYLKRTKKHSRSNFPFPNLCGCIPVIERSPEDGRSLTRPGDPLRFISSKIFNKYA